MALNNRYYANTAYSFGQSPLTDMAAVPIVAARVPTTNDTGYQLGTLWIVPSVPSSYVLVKVAGGSATWNLIEASGSGGVFSSLTVTPGPISLTGTTSINITGSAVTTIGTGGTGAVNIGNATGNTAVTGSLTTSTALVATTTVTAGTGLTVTTGGAAITGNSGITGTLGVSSTVIVNSATAVTAGGAIALTIGGGVTAPQILAGSGVPTLTATQGSLYLRTDGSSTSTRLYVNTTGSTVWTNVVTAA